MAYVIDRYEFYDWEGNSVECIYNRGYGYYFELLVDEKLPAYISLFEGEKNVIDKIEVIWPEDEEGEIEFSPYPWDSMFIEVDMNALMEALAPENITFAEGVVPSIEIITLGSPDLVLAADGYANKYVGSLIGKSSIVTIEPNGKDADIRGIASETPYKFIVDDVEGDPQEENFIEINSIEGVTRHTIEARVKLIDGSWERIGIIYINKYSTLFSGSVYIRDLAREIDYEEYPNYSAYRLNRNRDIVVTYDLLYTNDNTYAPEGMAILKVYKDKNKTEEALLKEYTFADDAKTIVIPSSDIKAFTTVDGTYTFSVEFMENNDKIGPYTVSRGVYISNNAEWYRSFLINGYPRSGVMLKKTDKLMNTITGFVECPNKLYIRHSLSPLNESAPLISTDFEQIKPSNVPYEYELDLAPIFTNESTNTLYEYRTQASFDGSEIIDMDVSRIIYISDNLTTISNLAINGDCSQTPKIIDGKLIFKPYWYREDYKSEIDYSTITYTLTFTEGLAVKDLSPYIEGDIEYTLFDPTTGVNSIIFKEVKGASTTASVVIDAGVFENKVKSTLVVEVDGIQEITIDKMFWPQV